MTDLPFDHVSCAEPFSGTVCLYNRDRREKLSEDFYFNILPTEMQDVRNNVYFSLLCHCFYPLIQIIDHFQIFFLFDQAHISLDRRGVFSLDAPSPSICLLIQLEKAATDEGGVTPSVYSRKEPVRNKVPLLITCFIALMLSFVKGALD
jgi:hypothetical protein